MDLCIECKTRPVYIKCRGLCKKCSMVFYSKRAYARKKGDLPIKSEYCESVQYKIQYQTEIEFIKNFFEHKNWVYHPAIFRVNGINYEPDFYDGERNMFIEVAGTRQAFHKNKDKYEIFIEAYPQINFEIRQKNGDLVHLEAEKQHINKYSQE